MTDLPRYKIELGWDPVQYDDTLEIESDPDGDWVKWADVSRHLLKLEGEQAQLGAIHEATMHALRGGAVSDFMESFPDVLFAGDVSARLQQLESEQADILEAYLDTKRLAREIDVALHGEAGAAQQASLCDLVGPAQKLRAALAETRAALQRLERTMREGMLVYRRGCVPERMVGAYADEIRDILAPVKDQAP